MLEDEELDAVALESTRTIDIERFVPPTPSAGSGTTSRITSCPTTRSARRPSPSSARRWRATETVGISRLVLYRRERAVMLEPRGKGIILWTLRYGDEVRDGRATIRRIGEQGRTRS